MIQNGKFFVPAERSDDDFKVLFWRLAAAGAGRPVDANGLPEGPWTPDLLADAISRIDVNRSGIDLRTVQLWFGDNERGISADNIRWLARIFGCGDPGATSAWQVELRDANARLIAKRRNRRSDGRGRATRHDVDRPPPEAHGGPAEDLSNDAVRRPLRRSRLAMRSEEVFSSRPRLTVFAVLWVGFTALAFAAYVVGVESVRYEPVTGVSKQVGFLWAPSWTILPVVVLPVFVGLVMTLLRWWRRASRTSAGMDGWTDRVHAFAPLFWLIFVASFLVIFLLQWAGIHLAALLAGDASGYMIDWNNVALHRPDVLSPLEAMVLSAGAYLYYGVVMWLFLAGLVLLYMIAADYDRLYRSTGPVRERIDDVDVRDAGGRIVAVTFRCSVLAVVFCILIRLQSTYLLTAEEDILRWLLDDARLALGGDGEPVVWLGDRAIPQLTTFLLLAVVWFVFTASFWNVRRTLVRLSGAASSPKALTGREGRIMIGVLGLLSLALAAVGRVQGFSLLLIGSALLTVLVWTKFGPIGGRSHELG